MITITLLAINIEAADVTSSVVHVNAVAIVVTGLNQSFPGFCYCCCLLLLVLLLSVVVGGVGDVVV